jgi:hypothetical protein
MTVQDKDVRAEGAPLPRSAPPEGRAINRPLHMSIGRIVLPSGFRGQERAFIEALTNAVSRRASGSSATGPAPDSKLSRAAAKTADAIARRTGEWWLDE